MYPNNSEDESEPVDIAEYLESKVEYELVKSIIKLLQLPLLKAGLLEVMEGLKSSGYEIGEIVEEIAQNCEDEGDILVLVYIAVLVDKEKVKRRLKKMKESGKICNHAANALKLIKAI